jgi:hypothetical protein
MLALLAVGERFKVRASHDAVRPTMLEQQVRARTAASGARS